MALEPETVILGAVGLFWLVAARAKEPPLPVVLPHPEEIPDYNQTMTNTDTAAIVNRMLADWGVPAGSWARFQTVTIQLDDTLPWVAACYWDENRIAVRPEWCNPGVMAHELAHLVFFMDLSMAAQADFGEWRNYLSDPYMAQLERERHITDNSDVETYSEIFRFLGTMMPDGLKVYYPGLV